MNRYPNAGSSRWMSRAALIRCASALLSRLETRLVFHFVVRLLEEAKHPAGHRHGDSVGGKVKDRGNLILRAAPWRRTPRPGAGSRSPVQEDGSASLLPSTLRFLLDDAGTDAVLDVGFLQPVMQSGFIDVEVLGDLRQRGFMLPSDRNDIAAELGGVGLGHRNILPARTESSQVRSQPNRGQSPPPAGLLLTRRLSCGEPDPCPHVGVDRDASETALQPNPEDGSVLS